MGDWVIDMKETGRNMKEMLKERHIKVSEVSRYMGFQEPQAVYKWLRGDSLPTVDNLLRLSKLLNVPMQEIIKSYEIKDGQECPSFPLPCIRQNVGTFLNRIALDKDGVGVVG